MAITSAKKLEVITKHAKNFTVKPGGGTPILEGVRYNADGSVVATDRHTLIRVGGAHGFNSEFTAHVKSGAMIDGKYPDTSRIIPMDLPTQIALTSSGVADTMARVKVALEIAKAAGDKNNITRLAVEGSVAALVTTVESPQLTYRAEIPGSASGTYVSVALNAQYLYNALSVFKDAGSKSVIIGLTGETSPIVLRDEENEIDIVMLPYRLPKESA